MSEMKRLATIARAWEMVANHLLDPDRAICYRKAFGYNIIPGDAKKRAALAYQRMREIRSTSLGRHVFKPLQF